MRISRYIQLFLLLAFLVGGCKKDDTTTSTNTGNSNVSGLVQRFGGQAIGSASVLIYAGNIVAGTPAASTTSNASGQWQANLPSAGTYTAVISASGLPTSFTSFALASTQTPVNLGSTTLATQAITGIVNDAQTGGVIAGAIVRFFSGSNSDTSGYRFADVTTNSSGRFNISLTLGTYVYRIFATGRVPLVANLALTDTVATQVTTTITQPVPVGRIRIVLNWGAKPSDLDSHLTGDSASTGPRYHVYYNNRVVRRANGDTVAFLDVDDITSYGPETITIFKTFPGTLRYKIHDYSNRSVTGSHYMSDSSSAIVRVYSSAGLIREDRIRTGLAGNQWYAYDINGTTQAVTFVNTIRDGVSNPADSSFRPVQLPPKTISQKY